MTDSLARAPFPDPWGVHMSKTSPGESDISAALDRAAAKAVREWHDEILARDFAGLLRALDDAAPYRPTRDELHELVRAVLERHKTHSPPAAPDSGARRT